MPAADAKGIRIHKVLDSLAGPVSGDSARLQQIVWNLLSNAVKFTPKGGKVQVLLERVNSHVEISVIDTGIGIKPEFLPHVFDRFRQADAGTTRRHGGLGLGLAIVKQLVEMHGGSIRAKSPGEGQGATFTVTLPITVVHPERPEPRQARPRSTSRRRIICQDGALAGLKVLVVDDEPDARQLLRRVLTDCEAEVAVAALAAEALAAHRAFRPDVIVSDIGMPEQDGYDFIRQVRASLLGEGTPGRGPDRIRPVGGPETGPARRLPDACRQAGRPGRTDGRRRQPCREDRPRIGTGKTGGFDHERDRRPRPREARADR